MVSFDLNQSDRAESQVDLTGKASGLSFLPNQIKGFLSKKQLRGEDPINANFDSTQRNHQNS